MNDLSVPTPVLPGTLCDSGRRSLRNYNRVSFLFRHRLVGHPLFGIMRLVELSRRMSKHAECTAWSNGAVDGTASSGSRCHRQSLQDSIAEIADNDSQVRLMHVERDVVLGPVLTPLLTEVIRLSGDRLRNDMMAACVTIQISSPTRRLSNQVALLPEFVLQLTGDRDLGVFDCDECGAIQDEALERLHAGDRDVVLPGFSRPEDACTYYLRSGLGVHVPGSAPYWAQTRDAVSVSLSVAFQLRSASRAARVYQVNRRLRVLGLNPTPPGVSAWSDAAKIACAESIESVQRLLAGRARSRTGLGQQALD